MDSDPTGNLLLLYIGVVIIEYGAIAAFSYAYYILKTHASVELQNQFQGTVNAPSKWLFIRGKVEERAVLQLYLLYRSGYKSLDEFFQKTSLKSIQFQRIVRTVFAFLFLIVSSFGMFSVPSNAKHLMIPYIVFLVIHLYTLYASWRFGYGLIELSQTASKMADSDSQ
ncbi:MAG: hypothetical protein ABI690_16060 [Chloroflexota bacterium]